MAFLFLGKLLIAIGLCFEAYTLFHDKTSATAFDTRLGTVLQSCDCIPADIQALLKEHLRMIVVGLLAFSSLTVLFRSCLLKVPVFLGLVVLLINRYYPLTAVPSFKDHKFWQLLAITGGMIYLMGAQKPSCSSSTSSQSTSSTTKATQPKGKKVQKATSTTSINSGKHKRN